jgi:hypothetical protein
MFYMETLTADDVAFYGKCCIWICVQCTVRSSKNPLKNYSSYFSTIIIPCKLAHRQCNVIFKKIKLDQSEISQTKEGTLLFFVCTQEVGIMVACTYNNHL